MLKLKMLVAFAVIGLVALSTQAFSQGYCYWDNWQTSAGASWWNNNILAQYALSAEQITEINKTRAKYNEKILPLQNELRSLQIEFRGYDTRYDADINKIKSYRKQIRDLEDKISDLRLDTRGEINKLLTKEQKLYFNDGGYGWWDMGRNWWHSGGNGMMGSGHMGSQMRNMNTGCSGNWK